MKLTKLKLKEIVREEIKKLNEAVGKAELKKMISMVKKAGARGYDIVKSLASDLSKSEDEVVSDLEKYNLTRMTEGNKLLKQFKLSSTEYQRAKKLSGFKAANYKWDSKQDLYIKEGKINEGSLYNRASDIVNVKDLYAFVKAGKDMKFELHRKDFGARQIQEFLQELIKKRIL